jgi:hypothetical protein
MAKDLAARTVLAAASTILEEFASYVQARYKNAAAARRRLSCAGQPRRLRLLPSGTAESRIAWSPLRALIGRQRRVAQGPQ